MTKALPGKVALVTGGSRGIGVVTANGRVISIGPIITGRAGFPGMADYAATKSAVVGYAKGAARDLAARKITVNVVQPGPINTDMNPENGDIERRRRVGRVRKNRGTHA